MSKTVGVLAWGLGAIVLPLVLVFVLTDIYHTRIVDSIYKNVEDISDSEMPPTVTSFQSGPEVVSTIGGSGEGLNCSLPSLANYFFTRMDDKHGNRRLVLQRFRQACVFHDLCYRHGLATYGYTQNDCDQLLQNEAFRLCLYFSKDSKEGGRERCQTDSKMILAGVNFGGSDAYRAWDRSTYFEFEGDPWRSSAFSVSRVVDHPFKSVDPDKYRDDPDQIILKFENIRSNLTVTCVTCKELPLLEKTSDRYDISAELRSVGIKRLPDSLLKRDGLMLSSTNPVWLPPRRHHAAPHLLVDGSGKNHLIWMTRNNPGATVFCIVLADAARLLTYTLPERDLCSSDAASALTMAEFNTFATSPLPMEIPRRTGDSIFATAISAKELEALADSTAGETTLDAGAMNLDDQGKKIPRPGLSFCSRSASRTVDTAREHDDDRANCVLFPDQDDFNGAGLGAFQNFAIVRPGQQIVFARDVATAPDTPLWTQISQNVRGIKYSPKGVMLLIDVAAPTSARGPLAIKVKKVGFDIPDRFDPMMPITRTRDDLRFLSLDRRKQEVGLRIFDFAKEHPKGEKVRLWMHGREISLHSSWARRPVLVLETRREGPKTKLVFSRAEILPQTSDPAVADTETLSLETLVFERGAADPSDAPFLKAGGAACTVKYTFKRHPEFPCYRPFDPSRPMRASPAARMQASQMLVGRFAGGDGQAIAFPDFCLTAEPVMVLKPIGTTFVQTSEEAGWSDIQRHVTCQPLDSGEHIGGPIIPAPEVTMTDWPLP
jgi:hypothetical protein